MSVDEVVADIPKRTRVQYINGGNSRYADAANSPFQNQALGHLDALHNFAMYLTRHPSKADDWVQETYLKAFRFPHRFELGTNMKAWLLRILNNTFLTECYRREREAASAENGVPDWNVPMFYNAPVDDSSTMGVHTDLERAMRRIPKVSRTVLLLAEVEGIPLEEVARIMACPVGTVKSRIFRAKERLRGLLRDYYKEYDGHYRTSTRRSYTGTAPTLFD